MLSKVLRMRNLVSVILLSWIIIASCSNNDDYFLPGQTDAQLDKALTDILEEKGGGLAFFTLPQSDDYANIPQDPNNPISRPKVELGKLLFHETALAVDSEFPESINTYSCASCHHAAGGFQANTPQGIGDGGIGFGHAGEGRLLNPNCEPKDIDVQPIRTPSALNISYQTNVLWNGQFGATAVNEGTESEWTPGTPIAVNELGFEGTEVQAIAGLSVHRFGLSIDEEFISTTEYKELFDVAFQSTSVDERYTPVTAGLAIAAYERTLLANRSPFQRWLNGDEDAMTRDQKRGATLFFKNNCVDCHTGPALSSMEFHAYGMKDLVDNSTAINVSHDDGANLGRGGFTKKSEDNYKFKVPQLYNLKDSPFYGHGSSFTSIKDVVEYKNEGISENPLVPEDQLSQSFHSLGLTNNEITLITEFIKEGLYDPDLKRYEPTSLPSGQCFPNNDALSRVDLQCF